jgi:hypothetical protein
VQIFRILCGYPHKMRNVAKSIMWRGAARSVAGSQMSVLPRHINRDLIRYNDAKNDIRLDCLRRAADWLIGRLLLMIAQAARVLAGSLDKLLARSRADHRGSAALRRGTGKAGQTRWDPPYPADSIMT